MTTAQRTFAVAIALTYVALAVLLVGFAFWWINPQTAEQYKTFSELAALALTADAALTAILGSFLTLSAQSKSADNLATKNGEILQRVEDYKKDIVVAIETKKTELQKGLQEDIEKLKGAITRQNEFLNKTLDAKAAAYNNLFVATTSCYRELENLAEGEFDKTKLDLAEGLLREAEALAANLDEEDRTIVDRIVQHTFNIRDEVEKLTATGDQLKNEREEIWKKGAPDLGKEINQLRDRSPFYNQKIKS